MAKSYKEIMNDITTFIFDVDGVLTDSSVFVTNEGEILRTMNIRDGYAMKAAVEGGYNSKSCLVVIFTSIIPTPL